MNTVAFRDFEERDIDFIHRCKNDEELNSMIVGEFRPFSYEESTKWVHGCMGEHETYKFWAVCTNDDEKNIVGWASLAKIDKENKSAFFHGIVIGDPNYRKGFPWIEIQQFVIDYAFQTLNVNRLEFSCLADHPTSMFIGPAMFFKQEGLFRQAVCKNGHFHDVAYFGLLKDEYFDHYDRGEYELVSIISRYSELRKGKKCKH